MLIAGNDPFHRIQESGSNWFIIFCSVQEWRALPVFDSIFVDLPENKTRQIYGF